MTYPWRRFVSNAWTLLGRPRQEVRRNVVVARGAANEASDAAPKRVVGNDASSIALGVIFCLFIVSLIALAGYFFFKRRRQQAAADVESGVSVSEKRNWRMVDSKDEKAKEWWRLSHSIPDRVEPPASASAGVRMSLQRLRTALTRKGALKGVGKKLPSEGPPSPPPKGKDKVTSPTLTIVLPMQTVPNTKPRYPSVLERGYRVPLYPVQSPPKDNAPPRSLTSPHPITVAERAVRRKVTLPPRALKISNGHALVPITERKMGFPRSPAHRRRAGILNQFKHPFLPLKDSDTAFPTISAPMPSTETQATNPKLGYAYTMSKPRAAPSPQGPRLARVSTRRIPVPIYVSTPTRPLMPATPLHLREETRVLPPGLSPSVPRPTPTPI